MTGVQPVTLASAVLALCSALANPAAAEAPFDLRATRAAYPGMSSVVLEHVQTITQPDEHTMRVATRRTVAVLDDAASQELGLFTSTERPGCRVPQGVRIEVGTPDGDLLVTSMDDLARLPQDPFVLLKGRRKGITPGALIHESYHVDYLKRCTGGLLASQLSLGSDSAPVVLERIIVDCEGCAADVTGPNAPQFRREGNRLILERRDQSPPPSRTFAPAQIRPVAYVSNTNDPVAWARILAAELPRQSTRWARSAGAWAKWAREAGRGMEDKTAALAYGLSMIPVQSPRYAWHYGVYWGEPVEPGTRRLMPLEWLALSNYLLGPKGGTAVVYNSSAKEIPEGAASIADWREYGILLPELGLTTTAKWTPTVQGESVTLAGHTAVTLTAGEPDLVRFTSSLDNRNQHTVVRVEPSGVSSVLVRVQTTRSSSWSQDQRQKWLRRVRRAKKRKDDPAEVARAYASATWFGQRRLTATEVILDGPHGMRIDTAWTERDAVISGNGFKLIPVVGIGLPDWLKPLGDDRRLPIKLGARTNSGTVTVQPPSGYRVHGLPSDERVVAGPIRFEATWKAEGGEATLMWSLRIEEEVVPPELGAWVSALSAAVTRTRRAQLVVEEI